MTSLLLNIHDDRRRQELRDALGDLPIQIIEPGAPLPPDVIVSDQPATGLAPPTPDRPQAIDEPFLAPAVLAIGWEGGADAVLPADAPAREVVLACSLLAEIVRLRRQRSRDLVEQRRIRQLVMTDTVAGIPNRRAWDHELARSMNLPPATRHPLVVAIVDLDRFKSVNDQQGHLAGDNAIRRAAAAISESLRETDFVARLGGDEFGLLLDDCAAPASVLDRIRLAIRRHGPDSAAEQVSASIGYAVRDPSDTTTSLVERADAALRRAKASGRDRVVAG